MEAPGDFIKPILSNGMLNTYYNRICACCGYRRGYHQTIQDITSCPIYDPKKGTRFSDVGTFINTEEINASTRT